MSIHNIPTGTDIEQLTQIVKDWRSYIMFLGGTTPAPLQVEFVPDLTPAEVATLGFVFEACRAKSNYSNLPDWVRTGTAAQAETYITSQILNGYTISQAETYIDTMIQNISTANVSQINAQLANIRMVFKVVADALVVTRGMFIITAKLLIYIRDLVIRFRQ